MGCALRAGLEPRWAEGVVSEGPPWTGACGAEQEGEKESPGVPGWRLPAQNRNPLSLGLLRRERRAQRPPPASSQVPEGEASSRDPSCLLACRSLPSTGFPSTPACAGRLALRTWAMGP